jgi:LCP family protein required for cell wall assembly
MRKKSIRRALFLAAIALLGISAGLLLLRALEAEQAARPAPQSTATPTPALPRQTPNADGGVNDARTAILIIGTDQSTDDESLRPPTRNGGQADFLLLVVLDRRAHTIQTLAIDRDTIAEIPVLGVLGDAMGTRQTQICLAYGFGDGAEQSCELQVQAVSALLGGIPISDYLAMRLDGVAALNDAVGGVPVTLQDDFSALDAKMIPGRTLKLNGRQAEYFVQQRLSIGAETNESRMARQETYLRAFYAALKQNMSETGERALQSVLNEAEPYLTTNMSHGRMINLLWACRDDTLLDPLHIEGEHVLGEDGFTEFRADERALKRMILALNENAAQSGGLEPKG